MASKTAPATPHTMANMSATALQMKAYNSRMQRQSVLYDAFENLSAEVKVDPNGMKVPNAIFLKLDQPDQGAHSVTIPMLLALQDAARQGTSQGALSYEEQLRLKHLTVYYNQIKKSVASWGWGINANDLSWLKIYAQITPLMIDFFKELRGKRIREALMLRYAEELTEAPISLAQHFTPNIFITNTDLGNLSKISAKDTLYDYAAHTASANAFPSGDTFSETGDHQIELLGDALYASVNSGSNPEYGNMDVSDLLALDYYVQNELLLEPIMLDGQPSYIFLVPANACVKLLDPTVTGSLGSVWKDVSALSKREASIPLVMGRVGSLVLVKDARYPTLKLGGSNGDWTAQPGFQYPGRRDGRNHSAFNASTNKVWDVGFVVGKGGLVEWQANPLSYAEESDEYGEILGKCGRLCSGIQQAIYDSDTVSSTSYEQNGSCMVLMSKPELVTVET